MGIIDAGMIIDPIVVDYEVARLSPYIDTTGRQESVEAYTLMRKYEERRGK